MKIVFNRQEIINCVSPLMCATSGARSTIAAVEGILFEAEAPSDVVLTTYDLEKGVRTSIEAKVLEGGRCVINAQKFLQTVKVMNGDEITLTVGDKLAVSITSGKSNYRMTALPAGDFPTLPPLKTELGYTVPSRTLREVINKVGYAMAVNDQRIIFNGTYFRINDGELLAVACDSFRMGKVVRHIDLGHIEGDDSALHFAFVVPQKTVNELYRMLPDDDVNITVYMGRKHMVYLIDGLIFFTRLIEGEYIDYDRIIIKNHRIIVRCPREELMMALEKAAIVTEEKIIGAGRAYVKLTLESGLLKVTAESSLGSSYDEIAVEHEGGDIVIAFNNKYLIDSVRSCTSDTVELQLSTPLTSVNVMPVVDDMADEDEIYFLLPVRMQS